MPREDALFEQYRAARAALIGQLVGDVVPTPGPTPAPLPTPGPTPAPKVPVGFLLALTGCVGAFVVGQVATPLLLIWLVLHPGPGPSPAPQPGPAPSPGPAPAPTPTPTPTPPAPTPVAGRLDVILVYNDQASDVAAWNAVKALKDDPATGPALKALDAHWECLPAASDSIDRIGLRTRLPDPAQLPTLCIYDSANFYGLDGKVLGAGAVRVPPPASVSALVSAIKQIRGVK